ncbi:hypothetical protein BJ170DRAFT_181853 [Xylariales sp. AK1849]|nr:hypothetical protein BJ170DRAFT_181853 [Xylariales sp. AK1849]
MAILRPLLSLVNGAAVVCGTTAESLNNLSASARSNRATLSSMASECLVTQTVLERLEGSLGQKSQADDYQSEQHNFLHGCFEIVVQAVKMTIVDVDCEIKRLKRYSRDEEASLLDAKPVPVLQDPFSDARSSLRRNRSSLNLVLDCAQRYVRQLTVELH